MESRIVGQLQLSEHNSDYFESSPFEIPYFDNSTLKIGFVEASSKLYMDEADRVLQNFLRLNHDNKIKDAPIVYKCYLQTLENGYTKPLDIQSAPDIWKFVKPTEVIIHWDESGHFYLCVSCNCEWELEHGLQLVFNDGKILTRASGHDGHFTD
jgi:uncharacterized protein DUF6985